MGKWVILLPFIYCYQITSPIYRTCSLNFRKCGVLCQCHSWQTLNSVFRVLSIPYTLALKAASITVVLSHHAHPYLDTISDICNEGANSEIVNHKLVVDVLKEIVLYLPIALKDLKEIDVAELTLNGVVYTHRTCWCCC